MTGSLHPFWHPERFARRKPYLEVRQRVIASIRALFAREGFAEVETPILQISPGNETHLHAFATQWKDPHGGGASKSYYLHTSPEFAMKKLLVAGMPKIFQLAHTFRNGERSSRHHPEFMMLEWYRSEGSGVGNRGSELSSCRRKSASSAARPRDIKLSCAADAAQLDSGLRRNDDLFECIKQDCIALVRAAADVAGRKTFQAAGMTCDPFKDWETLTVPDAFRRYADINLMATTPDPRNPDAALLAKEAQRAGIRVAKGDSWDDLFFRIMGEKIEPFLGNSQPTFLCDYPVSMAALARPKPENPHLAERFELYICGYELANAFGELTDVEEQRRRFKADMDLKQKLYGERYPIDEDFLAALKHGMPDSAGIALGVDRLVMLCAGTENIEDVQWIPVA